MKIYRSLGANSKYKPKLQSVQNFTARVLYVSDTRKFNHITHVLKQLHWLPINSMFKTFRDGVLAFKCIKGLAQDIFLTDLKLVQWFTLAILFTNLHQVSGPFCFAQYRFGILCPAN